MKRLWNKLRGRHPDGTEHEWWLGETIRGEYSGKVVRAYFCATCRNTMARVER